MKTFDYVQNMVDGYKIPDPYKIHVIEDIMLHGLDRMMPILSNHKKGGHWESAQKYSAV